MDLTQNFCLRLLLAASLAPCCLAQSAVVAKTPAAKAAPGKAAAAPTTPQQAAPGPFNRNVVVLDPAHGGADTGSRISDSLTEKDVTLALSIRLRSLLSARGFTVMTTRDSEDASSVPGTPLTFDDRAGVANRARPVACLLLHATGSGSGVHLYSSELDPAAAEPATIPWLTAQAAWVTQSQRLVAQLGSALQRAKIPLVQSRASVRPLDSLTCPAVVVEIAPNAGEAASLADASYQQHVAEALVGALVFWQNQAQAPPRMLPPPPPPPVATAPVAPKPTSEAQP